MSTIDEVSGAVGGNADAARELVGSIGSSKSLIDELAALTATLGLEAKANEAKAASEQAESLVGQAGALADALDALRAQIEALKGLATAGGSGAKSPVSGPSTSGPESNPGRFRDTALPTVTRPAHAPDPNRRPSGPPASLEGSATKQASIRRENATAVLLAKAGYDIQQNPSVNDAGKNPDYRIQGEYWDHYAPIGGSTRTIHTEIRDKVKERQAGRIVLNLDACGASQEDIRARLQRSPIRGLCEIKIVKDGEITQFYPWDSEDH